MLPVYRYFAGEHEHLDFSEESVIEQYLWESLGIGSLKLGLFSTDRKYNGYAVGKHWMDATVKMWRDDIKNKILQKWELYEDPELEAFHWWLDKVI